MYSISMKDNESKIKKREESKEIFKNFIEVTVKDENISETVVIKNFCEAYGLSYSTFIRWYIRGENINAKSEAQINKALAECFGSCVCHLIESVDREILSILTQPKSKITIETSWSNDVELEKLKDVFEDQISLIEEINKAISISRNIKKDLSAANQLSHYKSLTESCINIGKSFEEYQFNLYAAKVPYFTVEKMAPEFSENEVYLLIIAFEEKPQPSVIFVPNLKKIQ